MKTLFTILLLFSVSALMAQNEWQEHLSHDRSAYGHLGHFIIDEDVALIMGNERSPMNTLEIIQGNSKKSQEIISEYFTFTTKTTRTGIDSKEILLKEAFDYDVNGFGAHSIYEKDNEFFNRSIGALVDNSIYIDDAKIAGGPQDPKEFISNQKRYYLNHLDEIIDSEEITGNFKYHEGLNGLCFTIQEGTISSMTGTPALSLELGTYSSLHNDPYHNQLLEIEGTEMNIYAYEDFSLIESITLPFEPLEVQVAEDGYFLFRDTEESYDIYFVSKSTSNSELFYALEKTEETENFKFVDFEVQGNDIYFFGFWNSIFNRLRHSYVQKRTINEPFTPVRKDLELTFASVVGEDISGDGFYNYTYTCTVTNVGDKPVNHFTIYSYTFEVGFFNFHYAKSDVSVELLPGESIEVEGEFGFYEITSLPFHIVGTDFGLDSDPSNNSFLADVKTSVHEIDDHTLFTISPNPSANYISIDGAIGNIESLAIIDAHGQQFNLSYSSAKLIDITTLPSGNYALLITTKSRTERHHFIKI